jgi:hypothetical protein
LGIVRYETNGSLDMAFGNAGQVILTAPWNISPASETAIQADGKIVVITGKYLVRLLGS